MTLRLKGSTSGHTEIKAPASAGSNTITLPTGNGSAEQFLKNSGTAGELEFSSMVETSTGVGIGTAAPSGLFSVHQAASNSSNYINITNNATGTSSWANGMLVGVNATGEALVWQNESQPLLFGTNNNERMRISDSGSVNIGTTSGATNADITLRAAAPQLTLYATPGNISRITLGDTDDYNIGELGYNNNGNYMFFATNNAERIRVDSGGSLHIGNTTNSAHGSRFLQVGDTSSSAAFIEVRTSTSGDSGVLFSDGTAGDNSGFRGSVEYNHGSDYMFMRVAGTERMRITNSGSLLIQTSAINSQADGSYFNAETDNRFHQVLCHSTSTSTLANLYINRQGSDGRLIEFRQADNTEGHISVSGSTISYNGGHLSRWSQPASGAEFTGVLRGSVLSNTDEMCEWSHDAQDAVLYSEGDELPEGVSVGDVKTPAKAAYTEDNEQLNRMKISDVEGDPNVAGIFQEWDADEEFPEDFYCAMTGDFVIRIAQGTTVARGDLLMSAGDGTAKPQDDDIVRSKTIAKVTSTTVSATYSDNSYCVPCVLMAC